MKEKPGKFIVQFKASVAIGAIRKQDTLEEPTKKFGVSPVMISR